MAKSEYQALSFQRGRASISDSIPAAGTKTIQVSLDRSDYNIGMLFLGLPNTVSLTSRRRVTAGILFTDDADDAVSQATKLAWTTIPSYPSGLPYTVTVWRHSWYSYSDDAFLSERYFGGGGGGTATPVRIDSCRINGSNLEITFSNSHATVAANLIFEAEWRVWRS